MSESTDGALVLEHRDIRHLTADAWMERLVASVDTPVQGARRYPGFPDEGTQKAFVGSAWADALGEGYRFYSFVQAQAAARRLKFAGGRYLDFGAGWGRIGRFFLRDFERGDMSAVDVDPGMVDFCQGAAIPGHHLTIQQGRPLPFGDGAFRLVTAYSVFTHLPEPVFRYWLDELFRVTEPNGMIVLTVEPERFLDFVASIDTTAPETGWHAALAACLGDAEARKRELRTRGLTYLPTGGGPFRPSDVYGDTVVTPAYMKHVAQPNGELTTFLDDPGQFWQAVVVLRRRHGRHRPNGRQGG